MPSRSCLPAAAGMVNTIASRTRARRPPRAPPSTRPPHAVRCIPPAPLLPCSSLPMVRRPTSAFPSITSRLPVSLPPLLRFSLPAIAPGNNAALRSHSNSRTQTLLRIQRKGSLWNEGSCLPQSTATLARIGCSACSSRPGAGARTCSPITLLNPANSAPKSATAAGGQDLRIKRALRTRESHQILAITERFRRTLPSWAPPPKHGVLLR